MAVICAIESRTSGPPDPAFAVADALRRRGAFGALRTVPVDDGAAAEILRLTAGHGDDLIVASPGRLAERLAESASAPLLVVRDAAPFERWAAERGGLRAVLGWDDTATTAAALDPLLALRRAGPVDMTVVHVYYPDEAARRYGMRVSSLVDPLPEVEAMLRRDIARQLNGAGEGVAIEARRGIGHLGDHLIEASDAARADLIAVGTHHRGGARRLSSVAARVLASAPASVLLVPLHPEAALDRVPAFRTAVVATDGGAFGNRAVPYAFGLVDGGEVHLVRVVSSADDAGDQTMVDALLRLRPSSHPRTRTVAHVIHDRDAVHGISVVAERVGADVVCIASHGRAGLARVVSGSLTDRLLHVCRRPVLVVHPEE